MRRRRARHRKTAYEYLASRGFVKGRHGYSLVTGTTIEYVDFQNHSSSSSFTMNLGIHFTFMTGFFSMRNLETYDIRIIDCVFQSRIGELLADYRRDTWWTDDDLDASSLSAILEAGCVAMKTQSTYWGNLRDVIRSISPEAIRGRTVGTEDDVSDGYMIRRDARQYWGYDSFRMSVLLMFMAIEIGESCLACKYAAIAMECESLEPYKVAVAALVSQLDSGTVM